MPKRRHDSDFDYINNKLKEFEQKLKKCKRRRIVKFSSSDSSRDSSPCPSDPQDGNWTESHDINNDEGSPILGTRPSKVPQEITPAPVTSPSAPAITETTEKDETDALDSELLDILGNDPNSTIEYGKDIHKEIASRFEHITTAGLTKETRKELNAKYLIPANATQIRAPVLNLEIKAALPENALKRDKAIEGRQNQIAVAISCLSKAITDQLGSKEKNHKLLRQLMDAGRIICDIQHAESTTRRNFATYSVKKDMKEHLSNSKIDKYLFGTNLTDALKVAKAVSKSGSDLKFDTNIKNQKKTQTSQRPSNFRNLNAKAPAPPRRQLGPPRSREPAASSAPPPRGQHATSYKQSQYQQRQQQRR